MKYTRLKSAFIVAELVILAVCVSLFGESCKTLGPTLVGDVGHIAADCGKAAVRDAGPRILDDVASALITADYNGGLRGVATNVAENLKVQGQTRAVEIAWEIVRCSVGELLEQTNAHLGFSHKMDPETLAMETAKRDHAISWLSNH